MLSELHVEFLGFVWKVKHNFGFFSLKALMVFIRVSFIPFSTTKRGYTTHIWLIRAFFFCATVIGLGIVMSPTTG